MCDFELKEIVEDTDRKGYSAHYVTSRYEKQEKYDYKKIKAHCKYKGANSRRSFRKNGGRWDRRSYRSADSCDQRYRK